MEAWREVTDTFNYLPLAALIGNKIFCVHGGISPRLETLEQINDIQRPVMIQHEVAGLLTDLVWSDPAPYVKGTTPCFSQVLGVVYVRCSI
jgi:diadenosine tetraphosphatase ApaH/serine/threonine PP2A family protein phosphatase